MAKGLFDDFNANRAARRKYDLDRESQNNQNILGQIKAYQALQGMMEPPPQGYVKFGGELKEDKGFYNPAAEREKARIKSEEEARAFGYMSGISLNGEPMPGYPEFEQLDPGMQSLLKGISDYEIDPTKVASIRNNNRQKIIQMAKYYEPTYDMTEYPTRSAYKKEFSSGKLGANIRGFNTATQHLAELDEAMLKTPSSGIQPIEAGQRYIAEKVFGSGATAKAMAEENAALVAVSGELATIFKQSAGTDQEIEKWFSAYNRNASHSAKKKFIETGIRLMKARLGTIENDYERVMGKKPKESVIYPESERAIESISGQGNRKFNSPEEADASGLPPGTIVLVQGSRYQI